MKPFNNFRRRLLPAAAIAAAIAAAFAAAFAGCTKVDDTLGGNLIPENQQMKAGYVELLGEGLNPRKYVETRLFQSDSLIGSNISYGYFGTCINDTLGERKAGFLSQMINYYKVDEGYFGYMPIFDSAQIMLKIASIGRDSLTKQKFAVYEILSNDYIDKKPIAARRTPTETVPQRRSIIPKNRSFGSIWAARVRLLRRPRTSRWSLPRRERITSSG